MISVTHETMPLNAWEQILRFSPPLLYRSARPRRALELPDESTIRGWTEEVARAYRRTVANGRIQASVGLSTQCHLELFIKASLAMKWKAVWKANAGLNLVDVGGTFPDREQETDAAGVSKFQYLLALYALVALALADSDYQRELTMKDATLASRLWSGREDIHDILAAVVGRAFSVIDPRGYPAWNRRLKERHPFADLVLQLFVHAKDGLGLRWTDEAGGMHQALNRSISWLMLLSWANRKAP